VLPAAVNSERGRTEYLLVNLVPGPRGPTAYPMGKGSGSVTAFGRADGFVVIPRHQEYVEAGETVAVIPLGRGTQPADLVTIGSHCVGLDALLGVLGELGYSSKTMWVGSHGGLAAAARGECDVAGMHLLDPVTASTTAPSCPAGCPAPGYGRMQGIVSRPGDARFEGPAVAEVVRRGPRRPGLRAGQSQPGQRDAGPDR
jgi:putative molybdopterin biosynthesis protein